MIKSSTVFEQGPLPPTSTLRPSDIIHVIGVSRPSPHFFATFLCSSTSVYYTECKLKKKKRRRPGNEAIVLTHSFLTQFFPPSLSSTWTPPSLHPSDVIHMIGVPIMSLLCHCFCICTAHPHV